MKTLPYGRQDITQSDIDAVVHVLESELITQGPMVGRFEQAVAQYCQIPYAVAVNSATSALHIACMALGVGEGDHVWTSPNTFVATANCARFCGAEVGFVDIDPETYNLCAVALEQKLRVARMANRPLPKLVIAVHFAGQSCDMQSIYALSQEYGFHIIEDASHAIGGRYKEKPIGSCTYSDVVVFSFHPVKIITSGEGGIAVCRSEKIHDTMKLLRSHGVSKLQTPDLESIDEPWAYQQNLLGFNYRMTDIQASLGLSQMARLDDYVETRHKLASRYNQLLLSTGLTLPHQFVDSYSSYHLYPVLIDSCKFGWSRRDVYLHLLSENIGVNVHYIPVYTQPYYRQLGHRVGECPNAEAYYKHTLSLPLFGSMSESDQDRVVNCLADLKVRRHAA